jgi:hypothetical protein
MESAEGLAVRSFGTSDFAMVIQVTLCLITRRKEKPEGTAKTRASAAHAGS